MFPWCQDEGTLGSLRTGQGSNCHQPCPSSHTVPVAEITDNQRLSHKSQAPRGKGAVMDSSLWSLLPTAGSSDVFTSSRPQPHHHGVLH